MGGTDIIHATVFIDGNFQRILFTGTVLLLSYFSDFGGMVVPFLLSSRQILLFQSYSSLPYGSKQ